MKAWFSTFILWNFFGWLFGQHNPIVTYYASADYGAHHQNWCITESSDHDVFSANSYGLLKGNGNTWTLYSLPSKKIIRSVCAHHDRIYTGSHGDIGYWTEDSCGISKYTSLSDQLPQGLINNEEIWNIRANDEEVWFQSFSVLLRYRQGGFKQISLPGSIMFMQMVSGKKLVPVLGKGIIEINQEGQPNAWPGGQYFKDKIVTGIVSPERDKFLIATGDHGMYQLSQGNLSPWQPESGDLFSRIQINRMILTKNNQLVLGTINAGIYIFSTKGKLLHHLHSGNGLKNNTVLSLAEDQSGDVWAGLDKGMAKILLSKPEMAYKDTYGTIGSVYSTCVHEGVLYLGTNQGMYIYHTGEDRFTLIPGTQGQCWQLFSVGKNLYCGHNDGLFLIESQKAQLVSSQTGGWYHEVIPDTNTKLWMQGNYTGLALLGNENGRLTFLRQLEGFSLPVKKFIFHKNFFWVTSPNNGIYQLTISKDKKRIVHTMQINDSQGLPNADNTDLYVFDDTLRAYNGQHHYFFNESKQTFVQDPFFSAFDGQFLVRPLQKRQWLMIFQDRCIRMNNRQWVQALPVVLNRDYHNVSFAMPGTYMLCTDDGYVIIPATPGATSSKHRIEVKIQADGKNCTSFPWDAIPGDESSFTIQFFDREFMVGKTYQYKILPVQHEWKPTHSLSTITINHLKPGKYTLEIMRHDGLSSATTLTVLSPWYQRWPARIIYLILAFTFFYFIKKYYDTRLERARQGHLLEQERLIKEHEMELENQRLSHENMVKNKELANSALQLVHKNETLQEIKKELIEIRKSSHHVLTTQDFQILMKQINENLTVQENQKLFDDSFEEVNKQFFSALIKAHPDISKEDLKLAAYIKMDLTSKEIAPLLNLSIRGLENKRYRLRKKLGLSGEENLTAYFRNIEIKL